MEQISADGKMTTLIHFFTYELYSIRQDQTVMRDSWRETEGRIACMPHMTELHQTPYHPAYVRTNEVSAVTCPACKKTHEFARMVSKTRSAGINA